MWMVKAQNFYQLFQRDRVMTVILKCFQHTPFAFSVVKRKEIIISLSPSLERFIASKLVFIQYPIWHFHIQHRIIRRREEASMWRRSIV